MGPRFRGDDTVYAEQMSPNIFNIPASAPFLAVLIDALRKGQLVPGFPAGSDPLELARLTLYLPTRRACRLARDVFLDRLAGDAAILPRIVALGDLDEDEIAFAEAATAGLAEVALAMPPAFGALERRLTLAELISKWAATIAPGAPLIANTPEAAVALADALARLMDDMITRQVPWKKFDTLVPDDLDEFWKKSFEFLKFLHPAVEQNPCRERRHRIRRAPRQIDRGRGQAAGLLGRTGDRRGFHRLDAGDRHVARNHRQAAARRRGAARPRHDARRRLLGADRRQGRR